MKTKTIIVICITIVLSIVLSGCIYDDAPIPEPTPTPTATAIVTPTPEPTPEPIPEPTIIPTSTNDTDEGNWSVCDSRHNESWLFLHKCGMYSSSGSGSSSSEPQSAVPEMATVLTIVYGVFFITMLYVRKGGE